MGKQSPGCLIALVLLAGCKREAPPESILLVTIDTLRADHLSAYGYFRETSPRIDAFAADAILFERALTPMATTLPAHVSMLTSTEPLRHGVVRNGLQFEPEEGLVSLAEMLSAKGWRTAAFVSAAPVSRGSGIAAGFGHFDDPKENERRAEETTDRALDWLEANGKSEPFFVWIHYFDPHSPYEPPAAYAKFEKTKELERFVVATGAEPIHRLGGSKLDVLDINNRYDGEILYTDHHVGRLFDRLEQLGLYREAAIVLAADHGEGHWQHGWHDHGEVWNEQLFVPLIVKPPRSAEIEPSRVGSIASTIDIIPTLDGFLELPLTPQQRAQLEGIDLLAEERTSVFSQRVEVHRKGWVKGDKYALSTLEWKYFALSDAEDQLFDLRADRYELTDVLDRHPRVALQMKRQLNSILAAHLVKNRAATRKSVDGDMLERLRALGYLE